MASETSSGASSSELLAVGCTTALPRALVAAGMLKAATPNSVPQQRAAVRPGHSAEVDNVTTHEVVRPLYVVCQSGPCCQTTHMCFAQLHCCISPETHSFWLAVRSFQLR